MERIKSKVGNSHELGIPQENIPENHSRPTKMVNTSNTKPKTNIITYIVQVGLCLPSVLARRSSVYVFEYDNKSFVHCRHIHTPEYKWRMVMTTMMAGSW